MFLAAATVEGCRPPGAVPTPRGRMTRRGPLLTDGTPAHEHTNRLVHETSPYLLQHAHNPVDWYPWGDEALARARRENRPILLSIGYAACHWCHVMERESFDNEEIAAIMNELFVSIKVDREERPDLDAVYMLAVQMMTGQGGWPLTVFLTPDLKPFYGGTYFPPEDRFGRPGFPKVLRAVADYYRTERADLARRTDTLAAYLRQAAAPETKETLLNEDVLKRAYNQLTAQFDTQHGGFGRAPKFPQPTVVDFVLRHYRRTRLAEARDMALMTLAKMARGGMFDQLGGGFHRYSVDERWLVPHFEKMLYDNALLPPLYLAAYQLTGDQVFADVARACLDYALRDMRDPNGGFYASEDADSEGVEGKFYVWSLGEVIRLLGDADGRRFAAYYGVTERGNWEEKNILHVPRDLDVVAAQEGVTPEELRATVERGRRRLLQARSSRARPALDDKVLTGWNGLMISALAQAAAVLEEPKYLQAAERAARFLLNNTWTGGRLLRSHRAGTSKIDAFLEDHAFFVRGLLDLYDASFDSFWLGEAGRLTQQMIAFFWDDDAGGFFTTAEHHDALIVRMKDSYDGATPSGNSVAAAALQRLALLTGNDDFARKAEQTLHLFAQAMKEQPAGHTEMLANLDAHLNGFKEIVIAGDPADAATQAAIRRIRRAYLPNKVVVLVNPRKSDPLLAMSPLAQDKNARGGKPTFYVCENFVCDAPTTDVERLAEQLGI
jgi:uncharacterized protein YyaL (SSP411 family)